MRDRRRRNQKGPEGVENHSHKEREVADHLGLNFTRASMIMNQKVKMH
jgi:hypothetical protein